VEPPAKATCANCGAAIEQGAEFCANCGAPAAVSAVAAASAPETQTAWRALGYAAGIIFGFIVGAGLSLVVGSVSMTAAMSSKFATGLTTFALLVIVALLLLLIVRVARGKLGSSPTLNSFLVTFAIVAGSGLAICSGIGVYSLFGH
jgi:hypothetical protein